MARACGAASPRRDRAAGHARCLVNRLDPLDPRAGISDRPDRHCVLAAGAVDSDADDCLRFGGAVPFQAAGPRAGAGTYAHGRWSKEAQLSRWPCRTNLL